jgi:hypothetical protein
MKEDVIVKKASTRAKINKVDETHVYLTVHVKDREYNWYQLKLKVPRKYFKEI